MATTPSRGLVDLHCHILPGIDDGCKTEDRSLALLDQSLSQGVEAMFLTPHYHSRRSVEDFLRRREESWQRLKEAMDERGGAYPRLELGAEVAFFQGMSRAGEVQALCLGGSRHLLLELPFLKWSPAILREVEALGSGLGLNVVIAHLERYIKLQDRKTLEALVDMPVSIQMNAGYLLGGMSWYRAKRLISRGMVDFLGSDCHDPERRRQCMGPASEKLVSAGLGGVLEDMMAKGRALFGL